MYSRTLLLSQREHHSPQDRQTPTIRSCKISYIQKYNNLLRTMKKHPRSGQAKAYHCRGASSGLAKAFQETERERDWQKPILPQDPTSFRVLGISPDQSHSGQAKAYHCRGASPGLAKAFQEVARVRDWQKPFLARNSTSFRAIKTTIREDPQNENATTTPVRGAAGQPRGAPQRRPNSHTHSQHESAKIITRNTNRGLRSLAATIERREKRTSKRRQARKNARISSWEQQPENPEH